MKKHSSAEYYNDSKAGYEPELFTEYFAGEKVRVRCNRATGHWLVERSSGSVYGLASGSTLVLRDVQFTVTKQHGCGPVQIVGWATGTVHSAEDDPQIADRLKFNEERSCFTRRGDEEPLTKAYALMLLPGCKSRIQLQPVLIPGTLNTDTTGEEDATEPGPPTHVRIKRTK